MIYNHAPKTSGGAKRRHLFLGFRSRVSIILKHKMATPFRVLVLVLSAIIFRQKKVGSVHEQTLPFLIDFRFEEQSVLL